jgi:hypothetical protein
MPRCRGRFGAGAARVLTALDPLLHGSAARGSSRAARAAAFACACGTLLAGQLACNGGKTMAPTSTAIAKIVVSPDSAWVPTGHTLALKANAQSATTQQLPGQSFFWSSSDTLVATVTQSGVVSGRVPGAAQIGASAEGKSGFARVVVANPIVHSVTVTPAADSIYATGPGNSVTLTGTAYDSAGNQLPGRPLLWSTNSSVVTVSSLGLVTAANTAAGTAIVTATSRDSGFASASARIGVIGHIASVTVNPPISYLSSSGFSLLRTVQLAAILTDTFGHDVSHQRAVSWSSGNTSVATVNRAGLVTAVANSNSYTTITATSPDGHKGSATVVVFP